MTGRSPGSSRTSSEKNFRIVHLSIQRTHVHLLVEANSKGNSRRGMQGFQISAAKHLNAAFTAGTQSSSTSSDAGDGRSGDSAEASKEREAASAPGQSVLHQRADAAKRGFHRADALVSLAQGLAGEKQICAGDRPSRPPSRRFAKNRYSFKAPAG